MLQRAQGDSPAPPLLLGPGASPASPAEVQDPQPTCGPSATTACQGVLVWYQESEGRLSLPFLRLDAGGWKSKSRCLAQNSFKEGKGQRSSCRPVAATGSDDADCVPCPRPRSRCPALGAAFSGLDADRAQPLPRSLCGEAGGEARAELKHRLRLGASAAAPQGALAWAAVSSWFSCSQALVFAAVIFKYWNLDRLAWVEGRGRLSTL